MFRRILFSEFVLLFIFCLIFYVALHYFSNSAQSYAQTLPILRKVMFLRMIFSIAFAIFLGFLGVKMTGHIWPAAVVHAVVVAGQLIIDIPINELMSDWMLAAIIISVAASITALAGGMTLGYYWLRNRRRW